MKRMLPQLALPVLLLAGLLLGAVTGSLTAYIKPGTPAVLDNGPAVGAQIRQSLEVEQICKQILAGKLRVRWHRGEVHARNQCKRDGW